MSHISDRNEGYEIRGHRTGIGDYNTAMGSGINFLKPWDQRSKFQKILASGIKISKNLGNGDQNFETFWDQGSKI